MKKIALALCIMLTAGCFPELKSFDVASLEGGEGFDWNGRVVVIRTYRGLFAGNVVDEIMLESRDGRLMQVQTGGAEVTARVRARGAP